MERRGTLKPSVSVIIPTWNRWPRVGHAVDSALDQTSPPLEVLVIDDGSDDGTAEHLMDAHGGAGERLRVLPSSDGGETLGVSAARNRGIAEARGDWLAFLDSDDLWHPDKLATQLAAIDAAAARGDSPRLCHCDEIWVRHGRRVNPRQRHGKAGGWIYRHCLPLCAISPSAVLIHRRVFERWGTFDESLPACEDYDLWLRLTIHYPVLFVDRPLVTKHGGHDDQLSRRTEALDRYRIQALDKSLRDPAVEGENRAAARRTLLDKIKIYGAGARKRGRHEEADALDRLRDHWLGEAKTLGETADA